MSPWRTVCIVASLLVAVHQANALALNIPTATASSICPNVGLQHDLLPQVTTQPAISELRRRQLLTSLVSDQTLTTLTFSGTTSTTSEATCGFIDGDADKPVTCGASLYCATTSSFVGCCELSNCRDIFTSCYDLLGSVCDQACQNNPANLVCPSALPYCARYNYEGGSVGLGCAAVRGYTSTVYLSTLANIPSLSTPTTTSPTSSTPTATSTSTASSGLSTGATAGIAVGVTLSVVALAVAAFFFWRRSKKQKKLTATAAVAPTSGATSPPPETKEVVPKNDHRLSQAVSEMPGSPRTPMSPDFKGNTSIAGQPSPGLPRYSQVYEMPANTNERPLSYPPTELSSDRGGWR